MTKGKIAALRREIESLRGLPFVEGWVIERLAKKVQRRRDDAGLWCQKVLANKFPLTIPKEKTIPQRTVNAILDTLSGDLDDYEETFHVSQAQSKNGDRDPRRRTRR